MGYGGYPLSSDIQNQSVARPAETGTEVEGHGLAAKRIPPLCSAGNGGRVDADTQVSWCPSQLSENSLCSLAMAVRLLLATDNFPEGVIDTLWFNCQPALFVYVSIIPYTGSHLE